MSHTVTILVVQCFDNGTVKNSISLYKSCINLTSMITKRLSWLTWKSQKQTCQKQRSSNRHYHIVNSNLFDSHQSASAEIACLITRAKCSRAKHGTTLPMHVLFVNMFITFCYLHTHIHTQAILFCTKNHEVSTCSKSHHMVCGAMTITQITLNLYRQHWCMGERRE